jgi:hypothetical protein
MDSSMNPPNALPIVEAVERFLDLYSACNPNPAEFSLTVNSGFLRTVQALIRHAIAPTSVALEFWKLSQPYLKDVLEQHGDLQTLALSPHAGQWTMVKTKLLEMNDTTLKGLTEAMNNHAREWITILLLPSLSFSPHLCKRPRPYPQFAPAQRPQVHSEAQTRPTRGLLNFVSK